MPEPTSTLTQFGLPIGKPAHAKGDLLAHRPKHMRSDVARGLLASKPAAEGEPPPSLVEREGGTLKAGLIRSMSMVTRGEALGHGLWLDSEFIAQVSAAAQASPKGVKARFTHPSLSGDGLGTFLGRIQFDREQDGRVLGHLHLSQAAHRSPDGDLGSYVMDLAEEDPSAFGASIVFDWDWPAMEQLLLDNGAQYVDDPDYGRYLDLTEFVSPDPDNTDNLPHARLKELRACDVVDSPAANPDGLFHREQQFAQEADALASFALGLSSSPPALASLSVHPDRVKGFCQRFLESHGLQIVRKETAAGEAQGSTPIATPLNGGPQQTDEEPQAEGQGEPPAQAGTGEAPAAEEPQQTPDPEAAAQAKAVAEEPPAAEAQTQPAPAKTETEPAAEEVEQPQQGEPARTEPAATQASAETGPTLCKRFIDSFGVQGGAWYAEGLSFEQAQQKYLASLKAENEALRTRLKAAGQELGEAQPVTFQPPAEEKAAKIAKRSNSLGTNLDKVAKAIRLPGQNP